MRLQNADLVYRAFLGAANVAVSKGDLGTSEALYRKAVTVSDRFIKEHDRRAAVAYFHLSHIYLAQKRFSDAAISANRAVDIFKDELGVSHPCTGLALQQLAEVCSAQNL